MLNQMIAKRQKDFILLLFFVLIFNGIQSKLEIMTLYNNLIFFLFLFSFLDVNSD